MKNVKFKKFRNIRAAGPDTAAGPVKARMAKRAGSPSSINPMDLPCTIN
jgi:hypothetical protein